MAKYKVNEIFYSLQGEGRWAGRPAIFVRFSGCNLKCPFCDTDFKDFKEMGEIDILEMIQKVGGDCKFVVFTGGEPTLQVDEELTTLLHRWGYYLSIETNGTHNIPGGIDWVTCSPKCLFVKNAEPQIKVASEVKVVFDDKHKITDCGIDAEYYYVQPCDVGDKEKNADIVKKTVSFVESHPKWSLSLQQQKIINVR
mgnify:FL=1